MLVTIQIADHDVGVISEAYSADAANKPIEILNRLLREKNDENLSGNTSAPPANTLTHALFLLPPDNGLVVANSNGFVHTLLRAYDGHHHVTIRPDDVWMAILTQLSLFVNNNDTVHLRGKIVRQARWEVLSTSGDSTFSEFLSEILKLIEQKVVDPEMRGWLLPRFSTTTGDDTIAMTIVMMAGLQSYFGYSCRYNSGILSVTLLGEKEDYEDILGRMDNLWNFGVETREFADKLIPVLGGFIESFDDPFSGMLSSSRRECASGGARRKRMEADSSGGGSLRFVTGITWVAGFNTPRRRTERVVFTTSSFPLDSPRGP